MSHTPTPEEAFFFLQGSCRTQQELDRLWLGCFGYPNPATHQTPGDTMIYSDRQRHAYAPPPCQVCAGPTHQHWVSVPTIGTDVEDPDAPQWVPGHTECADLHSCDEPRA